MSEKELQKAKVLSCIQRGDLSMSQAGTRLGLSLRQVRHLLRR